jgi:hypothetical protein
MPRRILLASLVASISGCTTLADVSAGEVGCAPSDIVISDEDTSFGGRTWTAECAGRRFHCSSFGGGEGATTQVSCAPAAGAPTTTVPGGANAPAALGCQYDNQCKGDRLCKKGECVDPPVKEPPADAPATEPPPPAATPQ